MMINIVDILKDTILPITAAIAATNSPTSQSEHQVENMMNSYNKTSHINGPINYSSINVNIR